jgi:molecular chaperone Hsp33
VAAESDAGGELRRFVLERHPVRGLWVQLGPAWRELHGFTPHAPAVLSLLGEAVTAAVLLAATLKFRGTLTLQLQGNGSLPLLVAQCTHDFQVRATARPQGVVDASAGFRELVGRDGRLAVTIEAEERAARYQGIVALEGESLAACLAGYFATSEQLPTRLALAADGQQAAGVLLQQLPAAREEGEARAAQSLQVWEQLDANLAALPPPLLRSGPVEPILQRVCGDHDCRLFAAVPVRFTCRCNPERVAGLLLALGQQEVHELLAEQGAVTVTCEFCGRPYRFDAIDVQRLFAGGAQPAAPGSVN